MKGVNLIPQPLRQARTRSRRIRRWALGSAAYAAALLMSCAVVRALSYADCRTLTADISSTTRRIDEANRNIAMLRGQLAQLQEKSRTSHAISDQPDWSILLAAISATIDDELVLREVRLGAVSTGGNTRNVADGLWTARRYQLSLRGAGRSAAIVSKFVNKLEQLQFFDEVKLLRTGRETFQNSSAVGFELECTFGAPRSKK